MQFALACCCIPIMSEIKSAGQSLYAADVWALLSPYFFAEISRYYMYRNVMYGAIAALASKATAIMATIGSVLLLFMIRYKLLHPYLIGLSQFNLIYIIVLSKRRSVFQSSLQYYSY
jgi:hypothetical protein